MLPWCWLVMDESASIAINQYNNQFRPITVRCVHQLAIVVRIQIIFSCEKTNQIIRIEVNNRLIQLCCDYMNRMFVETAVLQRKELNILFLRMDTSIN